jgi:TadE-like protein
MRQRHSGLRAQRAQALAEMAVMVPFLVIGMMGMLDLGRAFYYQISLTNAVREAGRYVVQPSYQGLFPICSSTPPTPGANCPTPGDAAVQQRVNDELQGTGFLVPAADVHITPDQAGRVANYNAATPTAQYPVTVSASFKFTFITPIIGNLVGDAQGQLTINTSAVFRSEY